ncbi:DUF4951 domain-containing protein [Labrys miyagiensis]
MDSDEINRIKSFGITTHMLKAWIAFYKNDYRRNYGNPVAFSRYKLLETILEKWGN